MMQLNSKFILKAVWFFSALFLIGCAKNERAGDITLATQSNASVSIITSSSNRSDSTADSASVSTGSNLSTAYAGTVATAASGANGQSTARAPVSAAGTGVSAIPVAPVSPVPAGIATIPDPKTAAASSANGSSSSLIADSKIPARSITIMRTKPDCSAADCPSIKVKRINFIGRERFNNFLDQTMASMAEVDASNNAAFRNLAEFATYFWKISKPGYQVVLEASIQRSDEDLVVVQLDSYIFTGGAHGLSTTQYINWLPKTDKILSLEGMLIPRKMPEFEQALKAQHALWLKTNPQAKENPSAYNKLWPFVATDNAALMANGLAVTYDPYTIAPYSFGRPTLVIPYSDLKGILRPELLPD